MSDKNIITLTVAQTVLDELSKKRTVNANAFYTQMLKLGLIDEPRAKAALETLGHTVNSDGTINMAVAVA